jgi:hypothetical protein
VELASNGAFGALWIIQFVLCDRILFRVRGSVREHRTETLPREGGPHTDDHTLLPQTATVWLPAPTAPNVERQLVESVG